MQTTSTPWSTAEFRMSQAAPQLTVFKGFNPSRISSPLFSTGDDPEACLLLFR